MTKEERLAFDIGLRMIKLKVEAAFSYVRSDSRGELMRARRDEILNEADNLLKYIAETQFGSEGE